MSSLRELARDPARLLSAVKVRAPDLVALPRAVRALSGRAEGRSLDEPIDELQARILQLHAEARLQDLSRRDTRRIPDGYFAPPEPFCREATLRDALLDHVAQRSQRSAVYGLIAQYLEHFSADETEITRLAMWLGRQVRTWPWSWAERADRYRLFEPDKAPGEIAAFVLASKADPRHSLEEIGLFEAAVTGGMGAAAFEAACAQAQPLNGEAAVVAQDRLIGWGCRSGSYTFDGQWPAFAAALLLPWRRSPPPDAHRQRLSETLISYAGDPRTTRRQLRWDAVKATAQAAYDVFLAWLTRASVLQFLDVVGEVARDDHWKYRRAFWLSYLEAGHIECAWVAFAPNALPIARRMQDRLGVQGLAPFGAVQAGSGKGRDQSALLLKIGDLLIVEWSHSGKYNVWARGSDALRPKFFEQRYYADALDCAPLRDSHIGSDRYYWQHKLAELIRRETGLRSDPSRWRPGRT